jgi:hypothetical protein
MARFSNLKLVFHACAALFLFAGFAVESRADDSVEVKQQLQQLQQQNEKLQEQLRQQQALIDSLTQKVGEIQQATTQRNQEAEHLESEMKQTEPKQGGFSFGKVSLSGEGGVAFFKTGSEGAFPNSEFRVDEARLFVEAPIWGEVYFFGEVNLMTREAENLNPELGELYLDFENVSQLWNRDRVVNVRAGRMYTPFGEEYMNRYAIDNPLISHSLTDFWGVDEGVELYGALGKFSYAAAVQNGGPSGIRDFDSDKSVAGRISYDPLRWLHMSVSGMRTGNLDVKHDMWSELWFANGWIVPIGSSSTTKLHAELAEGDVSFKLPFVKLSAFGGYLHYEDNDPGVNNQRDIYYYSVEAIHGLTRKLYAGARFSQVFANNGYPIVGNGNMGQYLFSGIYTDQLWRLSLGLGYRWSRNLVVKGEYSLERGTTVNSGNRDHEDLFAVEAAFRF